MSSLQDRIDCRLATTVLPQAPTGMPKGWEWLAPPPPSKKRLLPWSDIAVLATLGVAYAAAVVLHGAGLGAL